MNVRPISKNATTVEAPALPTIAPVISLRERQKAATRETIVEATLALLAEEGYDGLTIAKVARRAGVANGLINYHFDGKEHLIEQAEARVLDKLLVQIRGQLEHNESPKATIDILNHVWEAVGASPTLIPAFFALLSKAVSDPAYRPRFMEHLKAHGTLIEETLTQVAGPLMRATDISTRPAATVVVAMTAALSLLRFVDPEGNDASQALEMFKQIVLDAVTLRLTSPTSLNS